MQEIYCRFAPSLGALEGTPEEVWGTKVYNRHQHRNFPTLFFGLYDVRDYAALFFHKGKKWVLWAGSDILNLKNNFLLNNGKLGQISKMFSGFPRMLDKWLSKTAEHWVENVWERDTLWSLGIHAQICPSFMGNKNDYPISYNWSKNPNVYLSANNGRQKEYGWGIIEEIASSLPHITFHLYGAPWITHQKNIVVHGRVPKEQMNDEIKNMQCGLRLNETDGFSEVTAKSVLWGQYPITRIPHALIPNFTNQSDLISLLRSLTLMHKPNEQARNYYLKELNNYPFNKYEFGWKYWVKKGVNRDYKSEIKESFKKQS